MALFITTAGTITSDNSGEKFAETLTNRDTLNALEVAHLMEYRNRVMRSRQAMREIGELERIYQIREEGRVELGIAPESNFFRGLFYGLVGTGLIVGGMAMGWQVGKMLIGLLK